MSSPYRSERLLRQNRQPRVLYTPEVSSPRTRVQTRNSSSGPQTLTTNNVSSTNGLNASSAQSGANSNGPIAILVMTPANRPGKPFQNPFYESSNNVGSYGRGLTSSVIGQGYRGVDWVTRISMALRSGIESEIEWALIGLMDLSCRQPEVLDLSNFDHLLHTLCTHITNSVFWKSDFTSENYYGSLEKDDEFDSRQKVLVALLIIRNLALDPKNAQIIANSSQCVGFVERGLAVSTDISRLMELKSYCIDIAESIAFHLNVASTDNALFKEVIQIINVENQDRALLIPALRVLARMVVRDETNLIGELPKTIVDNVLRYLTIDDEELVSASLDVLYQYTLHRENVEYLFESLYNEEICSTQLIRLLHWKMKGTVLDYVRIPRRSVPAPPTLSEEIVNELLEYEEPDRATNWIRASYVNDINGEVTQISLWKAYETQFESYSRQGRKLLPAVEFIKNVTSAFDDCQAMVVPLPDGTRKFIIKGIKPREFAVSPSDLHTEPVEEPPKKKARGLYAEVQASNHKHPPAFAPTAALVLQNLARTPAGKNALEPNVRAIVEATVVNQAVATHVNVVLSELGGKKEHKNEQN